jgi:hypothetical protein
MIWSDSITIAIVNNTQEVSIRDTAIKPSTENDSSYVHETVSVMSTFFLLSPSVSARYSSPLSSEVYSFN